MKLCLYKKVPALDENKIETRLSSLKGTLVLARHVEYRYRVYVDIRESLLMAAHVRMSGPTLKVLKLLLESPQEGRSGAQISKATKIGSGTMYPLLQRLELAKWIEGEWEEVDPSEAGRPKRRFYKLTPAGQLGAANALSELQVSVIGVPLWT
jgi:PadR family transcriptional regulator, regulatory protein PadR